MLSVRRREEEERRRDEQKQGLRQTTMLGDAGQAGEEEDQEWMMAGAAAAPAPALPSAAASATAAASPLPAAALTASAAATVASLPPLSGSSSPAESAASRWSELLRRCHAELSAASLSALCSAVTALQDDASLWPSFSLQLPSLLSLLRLWPASAPSSQWRLLLDALTAAAVARPSVVLLARHSGSSQPSVNALQQVVVGSEEEEKRKREARAGCLWSSLSDCLSRLTSALLQPSAPSPSPLPLCLLYRCCASLYPSTLSLLDRYGDQSGTVGDALDSIRRQLEAQILRPMAAGAASSLPGLASLPAFPLLLRHCAALISVLLLSQSPINQHDGDDASLHPHRSLSALPRAAASSSSSLASLPAVASEAGLYLPGIRPFSLAAVSASHPDLDAAALQQEAAGWVQAMAQLVSKLSAELAAVVSSSSSLSPASAAFLPVSCQTVQCLLLVARQRSETHHAVLLPALASLAEQLQRPASSSSPPLLPASLHQTLLHSLRLGLFACFRLPACLPHTPSLLSVLSQPHNSIIAMETARLQKQRTQQQLIQGSSAAAAASSSAAAAAASSSAASAALNEMVDVSSPLAAGLLSSLSALPVSAACELVLRCMERLPAARHAALLAASTAAAQSLHAPTGQHLFLQVLAALQLQQQQQGSPPAQATSTSSSPSSSSPSALPTAASAALLPPLTASALPPSTLSSLSRSSFSRILAAEAEAAAAQQSSLRAAILTAIAAAGHSLRIVHTLTVKDRRGLRALREALAEASAGRQPDVSRLLSGGEEAAASLSSSLTSSAEYSALLSFLLSDLPSQYELCLSLLYRLLHVRPDEHRLALAPSLQEADTKDEDEDEEEGQQEQEADGADEQQQEEQAELAAAGANELGAGSAAASQTKLERQSRKRPLSAIAAAAEAQQHDDDDDDDNTAAKQLKPESARLPETEGETGGNERPGREERESLQSSSTSSRLLLSVAEQALRSAGSVEYAAVVDCLLSAFDSSLFAASAADAAPAAAAALSPYGRLFVQFALDLPLLTAGLWSALSRYLLPQPGSSQQSAEVALAALRALIAFRPPAEEAAVLLLLQVVREGEEAAVRGRCLELAVEAVMRADARPALSNAVVHFAVELAEAVGSAAFLSDLPAIEVSVVIPPQPVYEQIALPPQPPSLKDEEKQQEEEREEEKALPPGADGSAVDGSAAADEARRRETQSLIAEAQRRRREFDKLSMRRELLIREKERLDRQAAERLTQRRQRAERQLAPLLALLRAARETLEPQLPSPSPSPGPPARYGQLFSCLLSVYRRSGAAEPARKLIHAALPAVVAAIGPTPSLLSALLAEAGGTDACVLHCLQLLCNNPLEPSQSPLALPSSSPVLVHAASPVALLCWQLFDSRAGDARFLIPLLPILRAEQTRRCLHRVVLLPPAHLKVAMSRLLKPQQSLAARGNKLTLAVGALSQHAHLSPADIVVQLHRLDTARRLQLAQAQAQGAATEYPADDSQWLRALIAACQLCFSFLDVFTPPVFVAVLSSLRLDRPLSRLLLRSCIQMIQLYPSLASFILSLLQQLALSERQLVQQSALWEGLLKVAAMTLPDSLELLIALPDAALNRLFSAQQAPAASPLALCRAALTRLVQQQPHRVRPLLRQRVMGGGAETAAAAAETASREQQPQPAPAPAPALASAGPLPPAALPQPPPGRGWQQQQQQQQQPPPGVRPPHAPAAYTHFFLAPAPLPPSPQPQQPPLQLSPVPSSTGWKSLRIASPAGAGPTPPPPPPPQAAAQRSSSSDARPPQRRRW